jgi:hypothetical protein
MGWRSRREQARVIALSRRPANFSPFPRSHRTVPTKPAVAGMQQRISRICRASEMRFCDSSPPPMQLQEDVQIPIPRTEPKEPSGQNHPCYEVAGRHLQPRRSLEVDAEQHLLRRPGVKEVEPQALRRRASEVDRVALPGPHRRPEGHESL